MTWHIVGEQMDAYLDGRVDAPTAASVEAHLVACADCRGLLAKRTPSPMLASSWEALEERIDAEPTGATSRLLHRIGLNDRHLRLLAPTLPLQMAWLGATALAMGTAALLVTLTPVGASPHGASLGLLAYLTLAAIAPLAAVAASLSAASEPAPEVADAAPISPVHVMGLRASAVLAATVVIALAAGTLVPGPWIEAALWLLPSLAMCAATTALSGRLGPARTASAVGGAWVCGVAVWVAATHDRLAPFRMGPQLAYLALAALGVALVLRRPDLMEPARARFAPGTPRRKQ